MIRPLRPIRSAPVSRAVFKILSARHHHAEIDHFIIVAAEHDADDIFADVVNVALHRGHDDAALHETCRRGLFFRFQIRLQVRHGFFHHARAFHHLRQKHAPRSEQIADHVHRAHQRTFDHGERLAIFLPRFFRIFLDVIRDAFDQRMREALFERALAPGILFHCAFFFCFHRFGERQQAFGRIRTAIQQNILDQMQQILGNFFVNGELAGIHDAHIEAGLNRVIQKRGVHGFAHHVVAAERK